MASAKGENVENVWEMSFSRVDYTPNQSKIIPPRTVVGINIISPVPISAQQSMDI